MTITKEKEIYVGDGLYCHVDKWNTVWLRAPREHGDHECAMEPIVLLSVLRHVKATMPDLFITLMSDLGYKQADLDG